MDIRNYNNWEFKNIKDMKNPDMILAMCDLMLKTLGVKYYLGFGTTLGFYRDKDFIPNDTDIDINIIGLDKYSEIYDLFSQRFKVIRFVGHEGKPQQLAFQDFGGMVIDFSFYEQEGDEYITYHEEGRFIDKKEVIGNCNLLQTKYGEFPFPDKIEDYLESHYGDWKTPSDSKSLTY
jgi:phosphorylcholine metabolism protein LicD